MLSSRFHPAAFITHLSCGKHAILIANLHFILLCVLIQHWFFAVFVRSLAFTVLLFTYPIHFSFFYFCCVNFFIGIVLEGDVAVLIAVCVGAVFIVSFILWASVICFFLIPIFLFFRFSNFLFHFFTKKIVSCVFFCIFFLFVWCGGAFWAASIESLFLVLLWGSMFLRRSSSLEWSAKPMPKEIRFWSQLLFVFVKRGPGSPDPIIDLGCLLLLAWNHAVQDVWCFLLWLIFPLWCCQSPCLFFCSSFGC